MTAPRDLSPGRGREPGCTCPELHAGMHPTGCYNLHESCPVHGLGTEYWTNYHAQRARVPEPRREVR